MVKRKIFYHTECGCILERSGLLKGPTSLNRRLICKEHGEIVIAKSCECMLCGNEIVLHNSTGKLPLACVECSPPADPIKENLFELSDVEFEILVERVDCTYRQLCIEVNINEAKLPCLDCSDYLKHNGNFLTDLCRVDLKLLDKTILAIKNISDTKKQNLFDMQAYFTWGNVYDKRKKDLQTIDDVKSKNKS